MCLAEQITSTRKTKVLCCISRYIKILITCYSWVLANKYVVFYSSLNGSISVLIIAFWLTEWSLIGLKLQLLVFNRFKKLTQQLYFTKSYWNNLHLSFYKLPFSLDDLQSFIRYNSFVNFQVFTTNFFLMNLKSIWWFFSWHNWFLEFNNYIQGQDVQATCCSQFWDIRGTILIDFLLDRCSPIIF